MKVAVLVLSLFVALGAVAQGAKKAAPGKGHAKEAAKVPDASELKRMSARFAPTELKVDLSGLSDGDRKALAKLVEAARIFDGLFMTQLWSGNHATYAKLKKDKTPLGQARLEYYWINKGPWSSLDGNEAFVPGVPPEKLPGANFYPVDMTKEEFESWVKTLSEKEQEQAKGFFTIVIREESQGTKKGGLKLVPYSEAYRADLEKCAKLLREAAALTENESLKRFLTSRAEAFLSNDYYQSDVDWMDVDAPIDPTIGPYETYNDEVFGYKAAYEAYINLRDEKESVKLAAFSKHLQEIENNLPIDEQYRNPKLGGSAPIRVVNEVLASGDGNHGVQTAAYNLPNDERVISQKGAKRVMLKNVQQAKFDKTLVPISKKVLAKAELPLLSFDWFFTHILAHELSHGLGPHQIMVNGQKTTPRAQLKDLYSAIEEAKADALGLYALQYMIGNQQKMGLTGVLPSGGDAEKQLYTTFLASTFRTLRFGLHEAHGRGMALQLQYLLDKGGFTVRPDGTFAVDFTKIKPAVRDLTRDLLMVEAKGDYAAAKQMLEKGSKLPPAFEKALAGLTDVPVDIRPIFVTANQIAPAAK